MKKTLITFLKAIRRAFVLFMYPRLQPLSTKHGYDRGTPIDRFWIEKFLSLHKETIQGVVLEITDNQYTEKFGGKKVVRSDVLDINRKNKNATIYGDLRNLKDTIKNNTYDCVILTHVLGMIDQYDAALSELYRILKPGGVLLFTSATMAPAYNPETNFWRFTAAGAKYIFAKQFGSNVLVQTYGNVLAGRAFWAGMAQEELKREELEYNDPRFPVIVAARAIKKI